MIKLRVCACKSENKLLESDCDIKTWHLNLPFVFLESGGDYDDDDDNDHDDEEDDDDADDNDNDDMVITMMIMMMTMTTMMIMMQVGTCFSHQVPLSHRCDRKSQGFFSWSGA